MCDEQDYEDSVIWKQHCTASLTGGDFKDGVIFAGPLGNLLLIKEHDSPTETDYNYIWLNMMRSHIHWILCHFLCNKMYSYGEHIKVAWIWNTFYFHSVSSVCFWSIIWKVKHVRNFYLSYGFCSIFYISYLMELLLILIFIN